MIDDPRTAELGGIPVTPQPDTVTALALRYQHPALEDRVVVRLVGDNLTEAEDMALAAIGLRRTAATPVGATRPRTAGFPAWPIRHDPANARHALNLVGDLHRAAKLARTKPKLAKELLDQLALTLGNSAPHFLPTFLEEAARIFIGVESLKFATQYFGKAREAERVHNLPIDEDRHREAFLEFALAGAISIKELGNESRAMVERVGAEQALEQFLHLVVLRTTGGVPPYPSLLADVTRLARAAGRDVDDTVGQLVMDLAPLPALGAAEAGFWRNLTSVLPRLATTTPRMREALLDMAPAALSTGTWLEVLEAAGVADGLRSGELDARRWVDRYVIRDHVATSRSDVAAMCALVRALPNLTGREVTIPLPLGRIHPQTLDALLAAGMTVHVQRATHPTDALDLGWWSNSQPRADLAALCSSDWAWLVGNGIPEALRAGRLKALASCPGTARLLLEWAEPRLPEEPTLSEITAEQQRIGALIRSKRAEFAHLAPALADAIDPAELLARSLRDGLLTELAWPALERAVAELPGTVTLHEAWPAVGVASRGVVKWIDGDQVVAESTSEWTKTQDANQWLYTLIDGVTGCMKTTRSQDWVLTWSNAPDTEHRLGWIWRDTGPALSLPVEGGRLVNDVIQRVGDATAEFRHAVQILSDGERYWRVEDHHSPDGVWEVNPVTGGRVRRSLPEALARLIEPWLRDGWRLWLGTRHQGQSLLHWHPATPTTTTSLLSTKDGIHGWVTLHHPDGRVLHLGVDGTTVNLPAGQPMIGMIRRPGGGHWLLTEQGQLCTEEGRPLPVAPGEAGKPHLLHRLGQRAAGAWHQLRVRDEAVSARMRGCQADDVAAIIAAAEEVLAGGNSKPHRLPEHLTAEAVAVLGSTDPALVDAVAWLAVQIVQLKAELGPRVRQPKQRKKENPTQAPTPAPTPAVEETPARPAAPEPSFASHQPNSDPAFWAFPRYNLIRHRDQRKAARLLAERLGGSRGAHRLWQSLDEGTTAAAIVVPEALLATACSPGLTRKQVGGLAALVGAFADAGLTGGALFRFPLPLQRYEAGTVLDTPTGPCVLLGTNHHYLHPDVLAWCPSGAIPTAVDGLTVTPVLEATGTPVAQVLDAFTHLLDQEAPSWRPEPAEQLAEATGWGRVAATVSMAALPWWNHALPSELLAQLGITNTGAATARLFLDGLGVGVLPRLVAAGAKDPLRVVTEGLDVEAMISCWRQLVPEIILIDAPIRQGADRLVWGGSLQIDWLRDGEDLDQGSIPLLLWLAYVLPGEHPLRRLVADQLERLWEATDPIRIDDLLADLRLPRPGHATDPSTSVPQLVAQAATVLGLDMEAARYWLQLLALPDPTDANVESWNGWTRKQRRAAGTELLAKGLVVEAKRSRAGRSLFLPGGWLEASSPHLPMEVWKAPFFDLEHAARVKPRRGVVAPTTPVAQLFADAWRRHQGGDVPGYVELRTERYRRQ
ncbi:MAG: hypothetical protein Q4D89_05200 [Arachnia propionica]|uniref:hypothetical protein n=1 Tax=Arachnia propionica TaxID=1750 RepID=UPI00270C9EED|nr:hypothetical protein [Arachnia propionica]